MSENLEYMEEKAESPADGIKVRDSYLGLLKTMGVEYLKRADVIKCINSLIRIAKIGAGDKVNDSLVVKTLQVVLNSIEELPIDILPNEDGVNDTYSCRS